MRQLTKQKTDIRSIFSMHRKVNITLPKSLEGKLHCSPDTLTFIQMITSQSTEAQ